MRACPLLLALTGCAFQASEIPGGGADGQSTGSDASNVDARSPDAPLPPSPCALATAGLAACWDFEGNTLDGSGNGNNASAENVTFTAGRAGMGLEVGATSRVIVADSASLSPTTAMTLEAWVRPASLPPDLMRMGILDKDSQYGLFIYPAGVVRCSMNNVGTIDAGAVTAGAFHHVACSWDDQARTMELFVDGQPAGAPVVSGGPIIAATNEMVLAADAVCDPAPAGCGDNLLGVVDSIRVWTVKRSATEICTDAGGCP